MTDEQISELIAKFDLQEAADPRHLKAFAREIERLTRQEYFRIIQTINNVAGHRDVDPRELDEFLYSQQKGQNHMREIEQQIWAATYAAAFREAYEKDRARYGEQSVVSDGLFYEVADQAIRAYRTALKSEDNCYLLPVKENWAKSALAASPDVQANN